MALSSMRQKHANVSLAGAKAVVVGGTSGIGMGTAERLAIAGANVTIVGRNAKAAEEILARMRAYGGTGKHSFVQCDVQSLSNIPKCVSAWQAPLADGSGQPVALDVLVLTQGVGTLAGYTPIDGIERKLVLHHYSRQAFIESLLPNLRAAASSAPGSRPLPGPRVLSVLSAGVQLPYEGYATDPDLKTSFSLKHAAEAAGLYNDVVMDARSRQPENAGIAFIHAAPGAVSTNWGSEMPLPVRMLLKLARPFMTSPLDCAEAMLDPVFDPSVRGGFHLIGPKAEVVKTTTLHEQALPVVWKHTQEVLQNAMQ